MLSLNGSLENLSKKCQALRVLRNVLTFPHLHLCGVKMYVNVFLCMNVVMDLHVEAQCWQESSLVVLSFFFFLICFLIFSSSRTEDRTHGLGLARQVLYH